MVGPTAVGKTRVSASLATLVGGEIVSADSSQLYRQMDVGTARPEPEIMSTVPHHLVDSFDLDHPITVAEYQRLARQEIQGIIERKRLPILVGGSGLYLRSVIDDLRFAENALSLEERKKLTQELAEKGREVLWEELQRIDPWYAAKISAGDTRRIIRALEVYRLTGKPLSSFGGEWGKRRSVYDLTMFGLTAPKDVLYSRIEKRVDGMLEKGLVEEVKGLMEKGYDNSPVLAQSIGYKEVMLYLQGKIDFEEMVRLIKRNSRRLAKKQLTWFRRDPRILWLDVSSGENEGELVNQMIRVLKERGVPFELCEISQPGQ
ncbi:tRNA (adenosine(37)-N6)-dimethylallyltransferase MiaA [Candidatus Hakubella thermalkaliphila]|uniref:tRNA (adenosine(37)-N6)-dimethylallyltransferase MiaA n=1 Tax=Candidatus Hakubella thermalkaliphila TaxID=2754717 RepID=UPI001FE91581|nr:tRNA (adenosine(37)-N6)-dimethylallyltransferase MiaA [Candidatus Hakubella thermalkaliphila]